MKSRRFTVPHRTTPSFAFDLDHQSSKLRPAEWGSNIDLRRSNLEPRMSQMGQQRPKSDIRVESARPSTADIGRRGRQVSFVPEPDSCTATNTTGRDLGLTAHRVYDVGNIILIEAGYERPEE
jgi:hypothetical protein